MTAPTSAPNRSDARNRAWRSLLQGLGIDVAVAVVLVMSTAVTNLEWSRGFWVTLSLSLAKTVIQSIVAYFMRLLVPPAKS